MAVTRTRDGFGIFRSLRVLIDKAEVGAVWYGRRRVFALEPGAYFVRVAMDWCMSEPYPVYVRPGEVVEMEGVLRWQGLDWFRSLGAVFVSPGRVFVVHPLRGQPPVSIWWGLAKFVGAVVAALTLARLLWLVAG